MRLFPFAVLLLCCSTVLSSYCNVSFYVLGILNKKKKGKQLIKCLVVLALIVVVKSLIRLVFDISPTKYP